MDTAWWGLGNAQLALPRKKKNVRAGIMAFELPHEEKQDFPKQKSGRRACMGEGTRGEALREQLTALLTLKTTP